jgi:8-oxo-dGTP diphosphatase
MAAKEVVRAAGVALLRGTPDAREVLLIHRSHRSDWSLPKGKLDPGEHVAVAAVRECDEETGIAVSLGVPLPTQSYTALGRPKTVHYWLASELASEEFMPNDEVDKIAWVPVDEASRHLTYPHDADVVAAAAAAPVTIPLVILRHTQAVKRVDFKGKHDWERPLSGRGRSNAKQLVPLLDAYGITQVHSSDATRCVQTVRKHAKSVDADIVLEPAFSEEGHDADPAEAVRRIRELAYLALPTVVCSHRPVLPDLMETLRSELVDDDASVQDSVLDLDSWDPRMAPGACVVLHRQFHEGGVRVVAVERHRLETIPD